MFLPWVGCVTEGLPAAPATPRPQGENADGVSRATPRCFAIRSGARGPRPRRPCDRPSPASGELVLRLALSLLLAAFAAQGGVVGEVARRLLDPSGELVGETHVRRLPGRCGVKLGARPLYGRDHGGDADREQVRVWRVGVRVAATAGPE